MPAHPPTPEIPVCPAHARPHALTPAQHAIAGLFRTNAVPSPADTQRIHQLLEARRHTVAAFTADIERARAHLARLEQQRARAQGVVRDLEALLSPVRRVPTDIIARIFEHAVGDPHPPRAAPLAAPLLLAQVCRPWRYLLFSLPCLWTALQIDMPASAKDWEALVQSKSLTMHVWFSRSRALPISLALHHPKGSTIPWHALMHLDKEILSLACRLRALSLHFSPRSLASLLTFTQSPLPYLERLELQNTYALPTSENPPPVVLHSAPMLSSFTVSWCTIDLRKFHVPWSQLRHLNLDYDASSFWNPVHSDYLHALALCPNLSTLALGISAPIDAVFDPAPIEPVTLPHVHTFRTNIYLQTPYLAHLFDSLRMPRLRHFEIKNVSIAFGNFTGQTESLPLLARCADSLESVSFARIDLADDPLLSCLSQLHRLRSLSFMPGILRLNHGLISALARDDGGGGGGSMCPALESLYLRCSSALSADAVERLVASRRDSEPRLKHLALQLVTFDYGLDARDDRIKQVEARLKPHVEGGLDLVLSKSSSSNCGSTLG